MSTLTALASRTKENALQRQAELERAPGVDPPGGDRPLLGALSHQAVDVRVEHVVQRARAAAGEGEPGHRRREERERRQASRADDHAARAGEQEQRHDPRLRQRHVVAPGAGGDVLAAEGLRARDERGCERERGRRGVERLPGGDAPRAPKRKSDE